MLKEVVARFGGDHYMGVHPNPASKAHYSCNLVLHWKMILPSLLPSFKGITLSPPGRPRAATETHNLLSPLELAQHPAHHVSTDARAGTLQFGEGEFSRNGKQRRHMLLINAWRYDRH